MKPFVPIPNEVFDDTRLSIGARLTYGLLRRQSYLVGQTKPEEGVVLPPAEQLAVSLGCSRTALRGYIDELRKARIVVTRRVRSTDLIYFVFEEPVTVEAADTLSRRDRIPASQRSDSDLCTDVVPYRGKEGKTYALTGVTGGLRIPEHVRVDGQDLVFNAIRDACKVEPGSPRIGQVAIALHGKGRRRGIRDMFWDECVRYAELHDRMDDLLAVTSEEFVHWLERQVYVKARKYVERMPPETDLTPTALASWWLDIENRKPRDDVPMTRDRMKEIIGER